MAENCAKETCFPFETGCDVEGHENIHDCKYFSQESRQDEQEAPVEEDHFLRLPWTSNAFGLSDLNFLTASTKPITIGITGVASAGKTTFLATLYCLLRQGKKIGDYHFAGSLTLTGWENIAWFLSWKDKNHIQYPPHTSSNVGRVPGLLHIALKNSEGLRKDIIFTDAPGEWFDSWAYNKNDDSAAGARWIHTNSDGFLLFADCELLSGSKKGKARNQIKLVAERLKEDLRMQPFGLIWSKSDENISEEIKNQISDYIQNTQIENFAEFQTSVREGDSGIFHQNILSCIDWLLHTIENRKNTEIETRIYNSDDLFFFNR